MSWNILTVGLHVTPLSFECEISSLKHCRHFKFLVLFICAPEVVAFLLMKRLQLKRRKINTCQKRTWITMFHKLLLQMDQLLVSNDLMLHPIINCWLIYGFFFGSLILWLLIFQLNCVFCDQLFCICWLKWQIELYLIIKHSYISTALELVYVVVKVAVKSNESLGTKASD